MGSSQRRRRGGADFPVRVRPESPQEGLHHAGFGGGATQSQDRPFPNLGIRILQGRPGQDRHAQAVFLREATQPSRQNLHREKPRLRGGVSDQGAKLIHLAGSQGGRGHRPDQSKPHHFLGTGGGVQDPEEDLIPLGMLGGNGGRPRRQGRPCFGGGFGVRIDAQPVEERPAHLGFLTGISKNAGGGAAGFRCRRAAKLFEDRSPDISVRNGSTNVGDQTGDDFHPVGQAVPLEDLAVLEFEDSEGQDHGPFDSSRPSGPEDGGERPFSGVAREASENRGQGSPEAGIRGRVGQDPEYVGDAIGESHQRVAQAARGRQRRGAAFGLEGVGQLVQGLARSLRSRRRGAFFGGKASGAGGTVRGGRVGRPGAGRSQNEGSKENRRRNGQDGKGDSLHADLRRRDGYFSSGYINRRIWGEVCIFCCLKLERNYYIFRLEECFGEGCMRTRLFTFGAALGLVLASGIAWADDVGVIVGFHDRPDEAVFQRHGGTAVVKLAAIRAVAGRVPAGRLRMLRKEAGVAYVEEDAIARATYDPNDTYYSFDPSSDPSYNEQKPQFELIRCPEAWDTARGAGVRVAVLDTGCQLNHPDIGYGSSGKVKIWRNFTTRQTTDVTDRNGHGTHTAGTVGARTNNARGVAAAGHDAELAIAKVLDNSGSGQYSWIAAGLEWSVDTAGAKVINMSLGGTVPSLTLENAVNNAWRKGAVLVAAAGNSSSASPEYPAAYENCLSVAAVDVQGNLASFSNFGDTVDLAAPGVNVLSTYKGSSYAWSNGTSMATPHVAGAAALVWSSAWGTSQSSVRDRLVSTATRPVMGENAGGLKILDAAAAVGAPSGP